MDEKAKATVFIENERSRVTEWRFAPGAATGWHRHEYDYVILPLHTCQLKIVTKDAADSIEELVAGVPYYCELGSEHDVISPNSDEFAFIEVEIK